MCLTCETGLESGITPFAELQLIGPIGPLPVTADRMAYMAPVHALKLVFHIPIQEHDREHRHFGGKSGHRWKGKVWRR